ncbi:hypothetical protein [Acinetobacter rudis]|uniref:hypothetical protein n=1 Tax=Acinetobacter rudis TaxID=632955 RepID=UPI001C3F3F27|nr:hypothetical protein [Acinetobacter rudis]
MRLIVLLTSITVLTACASMKEQRVAPDYETRECANYRLMQTAPLPPYNHEMLKKACL